MEKAFEAMEWHDGLREGSTLTMRGAHIQGAQSGDVGLKELRDLARAYGKQQGATRVVVEGSKRTTGANQARSRGLGCSMSNSQFTVRLSRWRRPRTIDLMKLIREAARVDLRKAKGMVEEVLGGGEVAIPFEGEEEARAFWSSAEPTGVIGRVEIV